MTAGKHHGFYIQKHIGQGTEHYQSRASETDVFKQGSLA